MKILVILGSARQKSRGVPVAEWVIKEINKAGHEVDFVDLRELGLPFYDEPTSPFGYNQEGEDYTNPAGRQWANRVGSADAVLLVHAEYNHGPPAILKNALDWVGKEWSGKKIASISYAYGNWGGVRAVEQLRQIVIELGMIPSGFAVHIPRVEEAFDKQNNPTNEHLSSSLSKVISDITPK